MKQIYMFKPAQLLELQNVLPPYETQRTSAALQFIIPGLIVGKNDDDILSIAKSCSDNFYKATQHVVENNSSKEKATLFTISYYIPEISDAISLPEKVRSNGHLIIEKFLSLLSLFAGIKCSGVSRQFTYAEDATHFKRILPMANRSSQPSVSIIIPKEMSYAISEKVFSALFWLRRGLAERDPIETFSSLMVCLQILAKELVISKSELIKCSSCGAELYKQSSSISSLTKQLVVTMLKVDEKRFNKMWEVRNKVVAHGNKNVTAETFIELTELKFEAALFCYGALKLALNLPDDGGLQPNVAFFTTDSFMYVD